MSKFLMLMLILFGFSSAVMCVEKIKDLNQDSFDTYYMEKSKNCAEKSCTIEELSNLLDEINEVMQNNGWSTKMNEDIFRALFVASMKLAQKYIDTGATQSKVGFVKRKMKNFVKGKDKISFGIFKKRIIDKLKILIKYFNITNEEFFIKSLEGYEFHQGTEQANEKIKNGFLSIFEGRNLNIREVDDFLQVYQTTEDLQDIYLGNMSNSAVENLLKK